MLAIRRNPRALADAAEIGLYLAERNPKAADHFVERLDSVFRMLAENPRAGRARFELAADLRSFPFDRFVVFYRVMPGAVEIVRVLSGYQDVDPERFA